jgi:DNA polymerase IV
VTRQHRLSEPTDVAERLYSVAVDLLNHVKHPGPFRLVGLVAYDLVGAQDFMQFDLFGVFARQRQLELAIDSLEERFGTNAVYRADHFNRPSGMRLAPTLDFLDDRTLD